MNMKIKKGDTVEIITGQAKDKGKRGEVIKVLPKVNRLVVQGANMRKKHQRQFQVEGRQMEGGIIEFEAPMSASNVMFVCPRCGEAARLGTHREDDGTAHRVCKSCGEQVD